MKRILSTLFILLIFINILIIPSYATEEKTGYVNIIIDTHTYRLKEFNNEDIFVDLKNHQTNQIKTIKLTNDYNYQKTEELHYGNYYIEDVYFYKYFYKIQDFSKNKPFEINDENKEIDIGINFLINDYQNKNNNQNTLTLKLNNNEYQINENIIIKIKEKDSNEKYTFHLNEENNYTFTNKIKNGTYIIDKDNSIINNKFKISIKDEIKLENNNLTKYINVEKNPFYINTTNIIELTILIIISIISIIIIIFIFGHFFISIINGFINAIIIIYKSITNNNKYYKLSNKINNLYSYDKYTTYENLKNFYNKNNKEVFKSKEFIKAIKEKNKKTTEDLNDFYTYRLNYLKEDNDRTTNITLILSILAIVFSIINIDKIADNNIITILFFTFTILILCINYCNIYNIKTKNIDIYKYLEIEILEELLDIKENSNK